MTPEKKRESDRRTIDRRVNVSSITFVDRRKENRRSMTERRN